MVSRATKRIWKSVALGLALSPAFGVEGVVHAQTMNQASTVSAVGGAAAMPPGSQGNPTETVRQLVREGRAALQAGDKLKAQRLAEQAAAMKVTLPYWEKDTPEKLLLDIGVKSVPPPGRQIPADPRTLVKQGYDALKAGRLEDAQKLGQQANAIPNFKWGLFDDTPSKLLDEVQKARAARDKADATKAMTDARHLFEQGKLDEAEKLAYKAGKLHGAYSMWDFGDKPEKLLAEIQTAKEKARKAKAAPPPAPTGATAVAAHKPDTAKKTEPAKPSSPYGAVKQASAQAPAPPPNWPADPKTPEIRTADVKGPDMGPGVTTAAGLGVPGKPDAIVPVAVAPVPPPGPLPTITSAAPPPAPMPVPMPAPMPPAAPKVDMAKVNAQQCMAEGHRLQASGKYVEARIKFQEAQRYGVDFGPTEETPDRCLMDLTAAVVKHINAAMKATGSAAEAKLNEAKQIAIGFGLDTYPIEMQLASLKAPPPAPPKPSVDPKAVGQTVLDKARLELKRGQCETARQLASEVYNGQYGLQAEAGQVLRMVDVEEHNQRVLAANRNFDAGVAAYRGKDYSQAMAILGQVDVALLAPEKKGQYKEVVANCAHQEAMAKAPPAPPRAPAPAPAPAGLPMPVVPVAGQAGPTSGVTTAAAKTVTGLQGSMPSMTAPAEGDSLAAQVQAMQEIEYQRLRSEGLEVQGKALQQFERGETDAALESLDAYLKKVKASKLDQASIARLQRPVDAKMNSLKLMKAQKDAVTGVDKSKKDFLQGKRTELERQQKQQQQCKELMKQFNTLYKEGKYAEAELAASKAHELDPDDPATEAAMQLAKIHGNLTDYDTIRKGREDVFKKGLDDAENEGPALDHKHPIYVDAPTLKIAEGRKRDKDGINVMRNMSAKDKEIQSKLLKPVQVNFHNVPLRQAVDDLRAMTGMNIHLETEALAAEAINPETPVSLKADNVSLKSALTVLLGQAHLTYHTADEMLKITTERAARGKLVQRVYSVADLVIPIDDYILPDQANFNKAMERIVHQQGAQLGGSTTPMANGRNTLQNGQPIGQSSNTNTMTTDPSGTATMHTGIQPGTAGSSMSYSAAVGPTKVSMQDMLVKLITNTVAPQSWAEVGGAGTIDYMPIGMALVINQTPDVQEQVADLLDALRRLQDLEVAVEVRIITLAETFFERIGLDFALNVKTDHSTAQYEPQLVTNNFKPAGQVNDFSPKNFLAGLRPGGLIGNTTGNTGSLTSDLDIPIRSSSFQYAIPPFAYPNNPGFNGGLSLGLAFLSDIQVFMFMEAAQGDRRTNVMQAPKLTLFNGQTASINVNDQQFFVTNVNVVGFGGQVVFVPVNNPVPLGVALTIQAVVSADRRFVRLNLAPTLSNLASAIVPLFPVTTFITPVFEGGAQGQPIPFTQFIQQPQVATVQIQTTVSIPDGGTVILGGMKTLSEGRNEFGPPVLSKLPYVNRLFKNVGYGREAQSMLLMVTPRIIINSEEEERQAGVVSTPTIQP